VGTESVSKTEEIDATGVPLNIVESYFITWQILEFGHLR
jgi:hypothetical protein